MCVCVCVHSTMLSMKMLINLGTFCFVCLYTRHVFLSVAKHFEFPKALSKFPIVIIITSRAKKRRLRGRVLTRVSMGGELS